MRIKKGDTVLVLTGEHKGKTGKVLHVDTRRQRVVVEGVNMRKRHQRPSQKTPQGGILEIEAPLHLSNVSLFVNVDGKKKPTRVGYKRIDEGGRVVKLRVAQRTGEEI
ncbi:MAG: 50S ribosomal protein L24 [Candidatus Zixiibacteriota bacterium]|nr:MAG: 50S ribosomal protein L24 [candidate division Zixibacteria bacterium]